MPSDVTGGNVFNQQRGGFEFLRGPVFTQLLLADEINRAPAKTQSSLLEAMQERSVTIDGTTRPLPDPFFVIATQNPIESQGTYPLPEAQLDRFLFKLDVRHPNTANEKAILASHLAGFDASALDAMGLARVTTPEELVRDADGDPRRARRRQRARIHRRHRRAHARPPLAVFRRLAARVDRAARGGAGARGQRGARLRHPRRRQGAGARRRSATASASSPTPRSKACRPTTASPRSCARSASPPPSPPDDAMPLIPTLRLVLLALGPLALGIGDGDRFEPARARCWPPTARCCCSPSSTRCWRAGG